MTLDHPIFARWPAQRPDRLQLFSAPTPNGVKVGIMLEETRLASRTARYPGRRTAFLALNPNGKISAIYDPDGPSGTPLALFESGAILLRFLHVQAWLDRGLARLAVQRGLQVTAA